MHKSSLKFLLVLGLLLAAGLVLTACSGNTPAATGEAPTCPEATACPECPAAAPCTTADLAQVAEWETSAHADKTAEAFRHWDEENPAEVPASCATCHSSYGFQDFLGADGSEAGKVDAPAKTDSVISCNTCHNDAAAKLDTVTFPSGVVLSGLDKSALCMTCHQGRASKVQVDAQIEKFAATNPDAIVAPIKEGDKETKFGFINIHYFAAAVTLYGTEVKGGYEYDGKAYDAKNGHEPGYDTCIGCHDSHTLEVKVQECAFCHDGVATTDDLKNIRMISSAPDYDGDGNVEEGMFYEIEGLQTAAFGAIQAYAKDLLKSGIVYDAATYPYWLADADGDGKADVNDKGAAVGFASWTPRLLKAAYNYQVSVKDPGAFAHGNKYIVQLLFDTIEDLNAALPTPVDMSKMHRDDAGHFAGNTEAFRHWDAEGAVPGSCAKCHSAEGLPQFLKEGVNTSAPIANGFLCSTCHDGANWPARYAVNEVTFPSGKKVTFGEANDNNLCINCHSGREAGATVAKAVAGLPLDTPSDKIRFRNIHYFAAGVTLFGSEDSGMYEYEGKEYVGKFAHTTGLDTCTSCHDAHALAPKTETCVACHQVEDPGAIRMTSTADYDGDGDTKEGLKGEVEGLQAALLAAIQKYATEKAGLGIAYDAQAYPYWMADKDGDGVGDKDDKGGNVSYNAWTPNLLFAAYNYQATIKDPGSYVHNSKYTMQILFDSIQGVGGDVTKLVRP